MNRKEERRMRQLIREMVEKQVSKLSNSQNPINESMGGFVGLRPINPVFPQENRDNFTFNGIGSIGSDSGKNELGESDMDLMEQTLSGANVRSAYCNEDKTKFTIEVDGGPLVEISCVNNRLEIGKIDE